MEDISALDTCERCAEALKGRGGGVAQCHVRMS